MNRTASPAFGLKACRSLMLVGFFLAAPVFAGFTDGPELKQLSDILPGDYHRSGYYRINDVSVNNDNYLFTIESDYGNFRIESVCLTLKYLKETETVSQVLNQISDSVDPARVDLKSQLRIRAESAIDILASPLGTAGNLAGQLARNLGDTFAGNSPYIIYGDSSEYTNTEDPNLGIHKRNIAHQLGLDVYSSNAVVQHLLSQLAGERSAGNISSGSVLINIDNSYERKVADGRLDREINSVIRTHTREDLYSYNESLLDSIGLPEDIAREFLAHPAYSPSLQTTIIKYMDYLYAIDNYRDYLALSLLASDEVTAHAFARILKMIAWYSDNLEAISRIKVIGKTVSGLTESNEQVIFYPDDLFYIDESRQQLLDLINERARVNGYKKVILVSYGTLSQMSRTRMLESNIDYMEEFLFKRGALRN